MSYRDELHADFKERDPSQFPVQRLSDEHRIITYMVLAHLPKRSQGGLTQYYPCIHGRSMKVTRMEMIHMIAALPEFEGVHPCMIENSANQMGCQRKDGNDHYVFFKRRDGSPIHKISNAGYGLAPFCTNYHSRPIEIDVMRTAFDNAQIYCPIWQKDRANYKDFDTRYEEAELITKPDAYLAAGIDPNTKCILTRKQRQYNKSKDTSDSSSNDKKSGKKRKKKSSKAASKPEPDDSSSVEDAAHDATQRKKSKKRKKKSSSPPHKQEPDDSSSVEDAAHDATQRKKSKKSKKRKKKLLG